VAPDQAGYPCRRVRRERVSYPGHVVVSIWLESERGGAAKLRGRVRFDDPWLNYGPMTAPPERFAEVFATAPATPNRVAAAIEQALALGWDLLGARHHHTCALRRRRAPGHRLASPT